MTGRHHKHVHVPLKLHDVLAYVVAGPVKYGRSENVSVKLWNLGDLLLLCPAQKLHCAGQLL